MDAVLLTAGCGDPLYRRAARVQYGDCVSDSLDQIWKKGLAGKGMGCLAGMGFKTVSMALCEDSVSIDSPELQAEKAGSDPWHRGRGSGGRYYS